ncbi:MAG: hypothetical protein ACREQ5_08405 [Candidatus Dormibacteria bacterium]
MPPPDPAVTKGDEGLAATVICWLRWAANPQQRQQAALEGRSVLIGTVPRMGDDRGVGDDRHAGLPGGYRPRRDPASTSSKISERDRLDPAELQRIREQLSRKPQLRTRQQ